MLKTRMIQGLAVLLLVLPWAGVGAAHLFVYDRGYYDWLFQDIHGGQYIDSEGVLFQHHVNEGGIMVLKMVLDRFGVDSTRDELVRLAGIEGHGTTMLGLYRAARAKGLSVSGHRLSYEALQAVPLPAIVLFNGDQYGVITQFSDDEGFIMLDPRWGRLSWTKAEFLSMWHGETLLFSKGLG